LIRGTSGFLFAESGVSRMLRDLAI
jgi:hypothetical protein